MLISFSIGFMIFCWTVLFVTESPTSKLHNFRGEKLTICILIFVLSTYLYFGSPGLDLPPRHPYSVSIRAQMELYVEKYIMY